MTTLSQRLSGYQALSLAIKYPEATINNTLFAVGLTENGYRSNYRKKRREGVRE